MDYFERSQAAKEKIRADSNIITALTAHLKGESRLPVLGQGNSHTIHQLGRTKSGLWVALRENIEDRPERYPYLCIAYDSYGLDAETAHLPPDFSICGLLEEKPFLLVEDVSEGGALTPIHSEGGGRQVVFKRKGRNDEKIRKDIGLGKRDLYEGLSDSVAMDILKGTFDVNILKYFKPEHRLDLLL